jgi:hypothetical protein
MKFILISAAFLVCLPAQAALIGWWAQNEASGNVTDATHGHAPATLAATGAVNYGQPGVPNGTYGSIVVTGASGTSIGYGPNVSEDYFVSGADNNNPVMNILRTSSLTVMSWINPQAHDIIGRTYRPISTGSGAGVDRGWGFGLRLNDLAGATSAIRFTTYGVADNDSDPFAVTFGEWIHIAATYDNGAITYYRNGTLLGGSDTSLFGDDLAAARLTIGARLGGNDGDQTNGLLDGIRVYNEVLSPAAIQAAAIASVRAIPEPSALGLAIFGVACLARRRRVV